MTERNEYRIEDSAAAGSGGGFRDEVLSRRSMVPTPVLPLVTLALRPPPRVVIRQCVSTVLAGLGSAPFLLESTHQLHRLGSLSWIITPEGGPGWVRIGRDRGNTLGNQ